MHYQCYVHDILLEWEGDVTSVPKFVEYFNNHYLSLAFTFDTNKDKITFLDLELVGDNMTYNIITSLYRKESAGYTNLHASSTYHQSKPSWRIDTNNNILFRFIYKRLGRLRIRGYPRWTLDRACTRVATKTRSSLKYKKKVAV